MKTGWRGPLLIAPLLCILLGVASIQAGVLEQCPDPNGTNPDIVCRHLSGGDGFGVMGDGRDMYMFSFGNVPINTPPDQVISDFTLKAQYPAPRIEVNEGQELYITMTNVGMMMRPDLFDPHSVHYHGFPNAAPIFDGLPEPSPTAIMGSSFTYYYFNAKPGGYFYHCHVEASEHMQMGMIGLLWVHPAQDNLPGGTSLSGFTHQAGYTYTYNDGDGSTYYDVEFPVQLLGFDSAFHDAHIAVQPLPFAAMHDDYHMINGRGYPHTVIDSMPANSEGFVSQQEKALITANAGDKVLLRVSNVSTTHLYTVATTLGVPMHVIGRGAELLRGPTGLDTSFTVHTLNVGGGQAYDVIIDTTGVPQGTYFLYTTNLHCMSNGPEERGGMLTEIVIL